MTAVNDPPTAVDDANTTTEDAPVSAAAAGVLANDTDPDAGDTKTVSAVNGLPANVGIQTTMARGATVTLNANGSYTYNPGSAFQSLGQGQSDTDTFTYTLQDGAAAPSTVATVTITITGVNDAPAGTDANVTINEDATQVFTIANFGFTGPVDTPDDALLAVRIATCPRSARSRSRARGHRRQSIPVATSRPGISFTPALTAAGRPTPASPSRSGHGAPHGGSTSPEREHDDPQRHRHQRRSRGDEHHDRAPRHPLTSQLGSQNPTTRRPARCSSW